MTGRGSRRGVAISRRWVLPAVLAGVVAVLVAGSAAAAIETDTVTSYPRGLWWAVSLITTVGFLGPPPQSTAGALLSVALMLIGFLLLAMVSAALAAMFVHEEEEPREVREEAVERATLEALARLERRLDSLEEQLRTRRSATGTPDHPGVDAPDGPGRGPGDDPR